MASEQKVGWAFIVAGAVEKEGFVMRVEVFKHSIDTKSSGNMYVCVCVSKARCMVIEKGRVGI